MSNTDTRPNIDSYIDKMTNISLNNSKIPQELYTDNQVFRGLRDINGKGVLAGLTDISEVTSFDIVDGERIPCDGRLYYRGYNVNDIVKGCVKDNRKGFEETVYLLLFGKLPTVDELSEFRDVIGSLRTLPPTFVRDVIMKKPPKDMMNGLARFVLTLYAYDDNSDDISISNVIRQSLFLISVFPMLAVYGYLSYAHFTEGQSLFIKSSSPELSTAENILMMLRPDGIYTDTEAQILDLCLILHAEHGGGNNSTFTTHVVSSSGTDTYSSTAASLCSLKGPKHGGANIKVCHMFDDMYANTPDRSDDSIKDYLSSVLDKKAFDKQGLIYGMGHAVYSISDPRAVILKKFAKKLSKEKGMEEEYDVHVRTAKIASDLIAEKRKIYKGVSPNVDFFSGMVYRMLGLPEMLFTPLFAVSRISGWSAHRIEELINAGKIIRPAYKCVKSNEDYIDLKER